MNTDKHRYKTESQTSDSRSQIGKKSVLICVHLWIATLCFFVFLGGVTAQVRPVYDRGAMGLGQLLKRLNTTASVMMIGAHPDDEDTALLAYLARGENARTAYLSLTRGDGGQNIIGPELGESLGVIRTEELIQARRLDGAEQYFTRAYDYGFSKTLAEAKQKWDEKIILCDVVRVIRTFRPLVVVSQFSGTSADGHGQHQYSGYISPLAVKAAADPTQCSDVGRVWQVQKFYVRHGFRATGDPRLRINTGKYDPLLGRSYFEIAMEARSQHRSQEQGVLELRGDQYSGLNLVGSEAKETGILDGLDTKITALSGDNSDRVKLSELAEVAAAAQRELDVRSPDKVVPHLVKGYQLSVAGASSRDDGVKFVFEERQKLFANAIKLAIGIQIDALSDRETVAPGESFFTAVKTFVANKQTVKIKEAKLVAPERMSVASADAPKNNSPAFVTREGADNAAFFNITLRGEAALTQPYWLVEPRLSDLFAWPEIPQILTLPIDPPEVKAVVTADVLGVEIAFEQPVEFRFADDTRGEIRRNVDVVPAVSIEVDRSLLIVPFSQKPQVMPIVMTATNNSTRPVSGVASLTIHAASEWAYKAIPRTFDLTKNGEKAVIRFDVTIPAATKQGTYQIAPNMTIGDTLAPLSMKTITGSHIQTHRFYRRALADVSVIDLKIEPRRIGYIVGSGDRVPDAIRMMGFNVEVIDENDLRGDLSRFDVIVVGIRVYQVRPDVVANNKRLLEFANNGGTLVVQYQLPGYAQQNLMPYPAQMGPRVADENAAIKVLQPEHPIFNIPNKITDADFVGWVQERNLYNFSTMDAKYTGLLESHDAGEAENKGGLVIADVGKGKYIYCSYSMFRQLPAGVPGAYRLFANILTFSKIKK